MRALLPASLALLTAAASAQVTVRPRPAPPPALGLSGLDCSAGLSTDRVSVPEGAPAARLEAGEAAPVPMPNVCADAAPLAVLPGGAPFRMAPVPPGLDGGQGRLGDGQAQPFRFRLSPPPGVPHRLRERPRRLRDQRLDDLRQHFELFDAPSRRFEPEWDRAPFRVRPPLDPHGGRR